jgi:hypothetical protein
MTNKLFSVAILFSFVGFLFFISSCDGEKNTAPTIVFREGSAYVYKDTALVHGTIFNIGINASKTGTDGLLSSCKILRSTNGGADSTLQDISIITQYFTHYYSYTAGDSGNTERYTFQITKNDGLSNSVSLTVTDK